MPQDRSPHDRGHIVQINRSGGGVPKLPVPEVEITVEGLVGDRQKNLKYHGGPDRAVCLWSAEVIQTLQAEGHPLEPGSTGENITIAGLDWHDLTPGWELRLGKQVELQITDYAAPCRTIARYFIGRRYGRISQKRHLGLSRLYARVISPGRVRCGDAVTILNCS
ncbi:MAG: MOSC domain-containing protein [Spirulinaceae cyanobacterium]